MRKISVFLAILAITLSCKTVYVPVPATTSTTVNVKDSIAWNIKDSVRITEKTRYRDFVWMGDTLRLNGSRSRAWAVCDTLKGAIVGEIEEDEIKEKTRIEYRDRIQYKDSVRVEIKPEPYPIEKPVPYIPKIYKILSAIGLLTLLSVLIYLGIKIYQLRGKGFLNFIKNIFKK